MITTTSIQAGTVNVLIGPNGSGKSRLLRELCINSIRDGLDVIAVAPTNYDRFRKMPKRGLKFFGARQGRAAASAVIRAVLERASRGNPQVLKNMTRALEYTKFDPIIGIGLTSLNIENFHAAEEQLPKNEADELLSALLKWKDRGEYGEIVRLRLNEFNFKELDALTFALIAKHDELLYRTNTTSRIEYFLYRKGVSIPLLETSSGEISFITTVAFISTQIERGAVIAIDEPETSLHPTWQQNYVRTLLDLFYQYEPRIVIATHSPIIISGAEVAASDVRVFEISNGQTKLFDHAQLSLEEMYDKLFDLITPKNHYLSQRAVSLLNALNAGEMSLNDVLSDLATLRDRSYDESQQAVIIKFDELAVKLNALRQGGLRD